MNRDKRENENTQTSTMFAKGVMISHYRIVERIGAGGMGEVYLAQDTHLDRMVALKFLPERMAADPDAKARFTREAQAAAKLDHPSIVTIHEVGEFKGRPFYAMQHVKGRTLRELCKDSTLPVSRIIELAIQMCEGLAKAHEMGIIHRDIKTANIVLDADGRAKILDFGLATIKGADRLTRVGSTLGTVAYMSPEQAQGIQVDHRSDLFSLGVVLYELITGRTPFVRDSDAATLKAIVSDIPEPLARFRAEVPDDLQRIISKLLEKDPALRYQSADGVLPDLKRLARTESGGVTPLGPQTRRRWPLVAGLAAALVVVAFGIYALWPAKVPQEAGAAKALVVLPFENLGHPDDNYFADGITDEITARLAGIRSLRVTSRTSAMQYKNTEKSLREIGRELDVQYVLEGTIRWDKSGDTDRVRIIPQLIRVSDDSHIWADTYERALTQVFAVQSDIATQITEALDITLLEPEKQSLESQPTNNLEAYDFYLRGIEYYDFMVSTEFAIPMFEKAVELDSSFYKAHAWLARLYAFDYFNGTQRTDQRLEQARRAAEDALRYAEGRPEGYLAQGYFQYYGRRDYDEALKLFRVALEGQPNNSDLLDATAYVLRRQGKWDEAVANLRKSLRLDPRSENNAYNLAITLYSMRKFAETRQVIDRALSLSPDNWPLLVFRAFTTLDLTGDTSQVRLELAEAARYAEPAAIAFWLEQFDLLLRDYRSALDRRHGPVPSEFSDSAEYYLAKGRIYRFMDNDQMSRAYFDSARIVSEGWVEAHPDVPLFHSYLGQAYAGLGIKQEAIREATAAVDLVPVSEDALEGAGRLSALVMVYLMVEELDLAMDLLEYLFTIPSTLSPELLRLHEGFDPLRDHPRFQALLEKYE